MTGKAIVATPYDVRMFNTCLEGDKTFVVQAYVKGFPGALTTTYGSTLFSGRAKSQPAKKAKGTPSGTAGSYRVRIIPRKEIEV